jgi:hypothetical protein
MILLGAGFMTPTLIFDETKIGVLININTSNPYPYNYSINSG